MLFLIGPHFYLFYKKRFKSEINSFYMDPSVTVVIFST